MINITLLSANTRCGIIVYVCGQGVMFFFPEINRAMQHGHYSRVYS